MGLILNILIAIYIGLAMQPTPTVEETVVEEVAVVEETVAESEPETPAEAPHSPQKSVSEQKPASVPSTPLKPAQPRFTSYDEFEQYYMGVCPKDVPEDAWSSPLNPSVAIGIRSNMTLEESNTPEGQIRSIWNTYRGQYYIGDTYRFSTIERLGVKTTPNAPDGMYSYGQWISTASGWYFLLDWPNKVVTVVTGDKGHIEISASAKQQAEDMAVWMTNYLRQLETQYNAKCGR